MKPPMHGWEAITVRESVLIPDLEGDSVVETVWVEVPAWRNPKTRQVFLTGTARAILEQVKARHLGLLTPTQIKELRMDLDLTQKQISELLQIGERSWTRWETGKERPSRSMNVLLRSLRDGRIDPDYLRALQGPALPPKRSEVLGPASMPLGTGAVLCETPPPYRPGNSTKPKRGKG